ncbi:unnamed protein product [Spirodela intermedia]|uniref:Uncharacterized protein n=1 Tax=Spirodela intermedia TaxID=51605 RepID=A0A7I8J2W0_SPIIN|nr:unnamed protein product [Spirodela intermedia]CAA6663670.1 unnamed protein product [Spirodela intermedia]
MTFIIFYHLSLISLWRRNYLERIKIVMIQSSLGLRLTHNEIYVIIAPSQIDKVWNIYFSIVISLSSVGVNF